MTDQTPDPLPGGRTARITRIELAQCVGAVVLAAIAVSVVVAGNPFPASRLVAAEVAAVAVWLGVRGWRMRRRRLRSGGGPG